MLHNFTLNLDFLVVAWIISLSVDWILQWNWQAMNKSRWGKDDDKAKSFIAVTSHSLIYAVVTMLVTAFLLNYTIDFHYILLTVILFFAHAIVDTRILVKYTMRFKQIPWEQINDYNAMGFMHIGIDHRYHELTLLALAYFVSR